MPHSLNRHELLRNASLTGVGVYASGRAATTVSASPNEKLSIACVGPGNQGRASLELARSQNIVALCDVDDDRTAMFGAELPVSLAKYCESPNRSCSISSSTRRLPRKQLAG